MDNKLIMRLKLIIHNEGLPKVLRHIRQIIEEDIYHSKDGSENQERYLLISKKLIEAAITSDFLDP